MGQSRGSSWHSPAETLDGRSLSALIAGEIPAIRIAGVATLEECDAYCAAIRKHAHAGQAAETAHMTLIGVNFSNGAGAIKEHYFRQVAPSYDVVGAVLADAGFDPLTRMLEHLRAIWPADVDIATEPDFGRYFAGGIKTRAASAHLHYDFAPHTAEGYAIGEITDQLGWNLYLDMPGGTGETPPITGRYRAKAARSVTVRLGP